MDSPEPIHFVDLAAQQRRLRVRIADAIERVLEHGHFIMGPEVLALEERLARFCGARYAVSCSSGSDALLLTLMALGIHRGDAVFVPTFTFAATAEAAALTGATPIFVDVHPDTYNISTTSLISAVELAKSLGLRPRVVVPVDLFGQPANYEALRAVAEASQLQIVADAAQSFGATINGRMVGTFGDATVTSFFPTKPLGCYGDGGAVFTDDPELASVLRSLRMHGQGSNKYDNVRIGVNARLDTLQAAILLAKLEILQWELEQRRTVAAGYDAALQTTCSTPRQPSGYNSVWAQYTIQVEERDRVVNSLTQRGIPTAVYYPRPLHLQPAYMSLPQAPDGLHVSERLSQRVLSLPMHPYLSRAAQAKVIGAVIATVTS